MRFELAREADEPELRRLLRDNPLEGAIVLALEREPSAFLAGSLQGDLHQVIVARDETTGRLLGSGSRAVGNAFVGGRETRLGYLSQLRLDRAQRGSVRMLKQGYALLRELHGDGATPFYVTTIVEDNRSARRFLEAGIDGLPTYRPVERLVTLTLSARRRRGPPQIEVAPAVPEDLDRIVALLARSGERHQFAPVWSKESLLSSERTRALDVRDFLIARRAGRDLGCVAIWDQRGFKQSVVRGFTPALALLRPFLNVAGALLGAPRLPSPGSTLRAAFLSHLALYDDDPETAVALVAAASSRASERGIDFLHLGLAARQPLLPTIERAFPHRRYVSLVYVVHWEDGARAVDALDGRVPHLEVAVL